MADLVSTAICIYETTVLMRHNSDEKPRFKKSYKRIDHVVEYKINESGVFTCLLA